MAASSTVSVSTDDHDHDHIRSPTLGSDEHDFHEQPPQRLSALYQYHNAPEVAPAHGLEYDDTPYPVSDKYPVVRELNYANSYNAKHTYSNNNNNNSNSRPPRIIFGMKIPTFFMVAGVMSLIIVGAAVGGAVGGKTLRDGPIDNGMSSGTGVVSTSASSSTSHPSSTTTFVAATPTYTPMSDCPASNDTSYTSSYAQSSGSVPAGTGLNFTKYCDISSPLADSSATRVAEAYVYSFSDCVEICAGYNFLNADSNCTVAVYKAKGTRPSNCWIGSSNNNDVSALENQNGTDVALLESHS
ncbi:Hypothetical protein R9X50_00036200 [Acrodontium crateriforme]|uniref:Apple domain-containing protein n=1 Tax=Acrodontium crateriforme TaxID=150365 RepID=A0AAQ3R716_9PEZI|nr:Hypothetical protein R9X50_00036200 [Acrodontium crateriforme]